MKFQARPLLSRALETGELGELHDPRLEKNYDETEMFRMIEAAAACTRHSAAMRPQMGKVMMKHYKSTCKTNTFRCILSKLVLATGGQSS